MSELPRLRWTKYDRGFRAYPMGTGTQGRFAWIFAQLTTVDTSSKAFNRVESWHWSVNWEGWFSVTASASSKQEAADKATAAWWKSVADPLPRNVDLELDMIVARILVMPPPNSLLTEDTAFLQRLNRMVFSQFEREIKADAAPMPVRNLLTSLSAELYARRLAGNGAAEAPNSWSST